MKAIKYKIAEILVFPIKMTNKLVKPAGECLMYLHSFRSLQHDLCFIVKIFTIGAVQRTARY